MPKNKIEANNTDYFNNDESNDIIDKIFKRDFLVILERNGYSEDDLKKFFQEKQISSIAQNQFNYTLRRINKQCGISLIDMVIFLENSINKLKKILLTLDEETTHILKKELSDKYKIKITKNTLFELLK